MLFNLLYGKSLEVSKIEVGVTVSSLYCYWFVIS